MNLSQAMITGQGIHIDEALSEGLKVTGVGLAIVFSVLIILMIVLYLFKLIFYKEPKNAQETAAVPAVQETAVQDEPDDEELIAVLTAAVAASLNTSTYNLRIKSYRRINNNVPAWNKAGVNETVNNHIF